MMETRARTFGVKAAAAVLASLCLLAPAAAAPYAAVACSVTHP